MTHSPRFQSHEPPSALLVQNRRHLKISLAGSAHLRSANHAATLRQAIPSCESPSKVFSSLPRNLTHLIMGEALMARVWPNLFVEPANLTVHMSALRRALRDGRDGNRFIINIPGRG